VGVGSGGGPPACAFRAGANGAVRIVWPGNSGARAFPSSDVNTI
jgi:hypothetical protein